MKKINVAELLKDCPKGMELYSPIFGTVYFEGIRDTGRAMLIDVTTSCNTSVQFYSNGKFNTYYSESEVTLFPSKSQRDWSKFQRPFKDGDILATDLGSVFFLNTRLNTDECYGCYVGIGGDGSFHICEPFAYKECCGFATEEEKQKLFQAIKDNDYNWNAETKTLEKITQPNFKVGDWVTDGVSKCQIHFIDGTRYWYSENCILGSIESVDKRYHLWTINDAKDGDVLFHSDSASNGIFIFKEILQHGTMQKVICYCDYDSEDGFCLGENHTCCWTDSKILRLATKEQCNLLFQKIKENGYKWNAETKTLEKLIEPIFKVGDRITNGKVSITIGYIDDNYYYEFGRIIANRLFIKNQDDWRLVSNKFDITTLKPFESRVLVRDSKIGTWKPAYWGCYDKTNNMNYPYVIVGGSVYGMGIPYEGNEHLLGTTNDCDEFYKTWEL